MQSMRLANIKQSGTPDRETPMSPMVPLCSSNDPFDVIGGQGKQEAVFTSSLA